MVDDLEFCFGMLIFDEKLKRLGRKIGYSFAVVVMFLVIFVQVFSGFVVGGFLLVGVNLVNQFIGNSIIDVLKVGDLNVNFDGMVFMVFFSVIQVVIGISVGLFMSVLIVYFFGK